MKKSWISLPWQNIYLRILVIQRKICQSTKQYNKNNLYKLQKYLLNCNEAKILSVHKITEALSKYCNHYLYNKKIRINDKQKYLLLQLLLGDKIESSINIHVLLEQIKQYLVYLCIQPEWRAKLDFKYQHKVNLYRNSSKDRDDFISSLFVYHSSFYNRIVIEKKCDCICFFYNKYLTTNYVITKLQSFNYINKSIVYWLNNNYIVQYINSFQSCTYRYISKISYKHYNVLYILQYLLCHVLWLGSNWYTFYKTKLHEQNINYLQYNIYYKCFDDESIHLKNIYKIVKSVMYKCNIFNQTMPNTALKIININQKIIYHIKVYSQDNVLDISRILISKIYKMMNIIIYYWLRKKYTRSLYNILLYINNVYLNFYFYHFKYKVFYNSILE
uniref:Reverse transcriptase N-terminal domain-containing protein n=1 Tax=Bornetia secundiflora TaxID=2575637 RepID=A0A4D6WLA5_9FLOR|nr:hypothetical protein [Bornetia secundiflora]